MRVSDTIDVVRLMIKTAKKSQTTMDGVVVIDAAKYIKRLNVELSLLEQQDEEDAINEAFDEAVHFGG